MYITNSFKDYRVLDCGGGEKLEKWGRFVLRRPDPQVIWDTDKESALWKNVNAVYHRSKSGGGSWEFFDLPKEWKIDYTLLSNNKTLSFNLKPFSFKHTGLFPEQAVNWEWFSSIINEEKKRHPEKEIKVLNLFSYTGGATLAASSAGAEVVHVDASKGMVSWAKENALISGLSENRIRYIVDDSVKFVKREIRRGNLYDGIIMDPPSYGRGPKGETWKIEDDVFSFIKLTASLLKRKPLFFLINSYTTGLQSTVLYDMLSIALKDFDGVVEADEVVLPVENKGIFLPCGCSGRFTGV